MLSSRARCGKFSSKLFTVKWQGGLASEVKKELIQDSCETGKIFRAMQSKFFSDVTIFN